MGDSNRRCSLCDEPFDNRPWLLLNRYAIGTGANSAMVQGLNNDGECRWDIDGDVASGAALHTPDCLAMWLQAKALSVDADNGKLP